MFTDACAIIAVLSDENEAECVSNAIASSKAPFTSPIAVLGLVRPDKFNLPVTSIEALVMEFLEARNIDVRDLPPAKDTTRLALHATAEFRSGRHGLNLGDCLHYACAKFHDVPILATADEFRHTDLRKIP